MGKLYCGVVREVGIIRGIGERHTFFAVGQDDAYRELAGPDSCDIKSSVWSEDAISKSKLVKLVTSNE